MACVMHAHIAVTGRLMSCTMLAKSGEIALCGKKVIINNVYVFASRAGEISGRFKS